MDYNKKYVSSKLESNLIAFKVFDRFTRKYVSLPNRHTSLIFSVVIWNILSGISSKQAYKLFFPFVGKTQTKHLPDQYNAVLYSLFTNLFQQKMSSIINVLPNINLARLNLNSTSTQNHFYVYRFPHMILYSI